MLKRKITALLESWFHASAGRALLLTGARQVGKTTVVRAFAAERGLALAEVNFYENRDAVSLVNEARDVDELLFRLSALTHMTIRPDETLLFLDEVQECQDMLTWVKFLIEKRGLRIVLSGSLLGVDAFLDARSLPVGFARTVEMFPLDFEEFGWACGLPEGMLAHALEAVAARRAVGSFEHEQLLRAWRTYLLVGGMPAAVQAHVETSQLGAARAVQNDITALYKADIVKYVEDKVEARQVKMVYEAIPGQLNAPSKRFKYARLGKNLRFANMETAFDWLEAAGVALCVPRTGSVSFPSALAEDRSSIKLFMNDVGLLTSQLMGDADIDVLGAAAAFNYGSIYENAVAQELRAQGFAPRYYFSTKRGEVDFVVEDSARGIAVPVEVKSGKDYRRHSALSNVLAAGEVATWACVLCDGNATFSEGRAYIPVYLSGKLRELAFLWEKPMPPVTTG